MNILLTIFLVLLGVVAIIAGVTFFTWLLVHVLAPMTEDKELPPPPRQSAVD